jgi:hypothetical protein
VIFCDFKRTTKGEGKHLENTDTEVLKRGYRIGLETRVVHAVNDGCCMCAYVIFFFKGGHSKACVSANALNTPPGDYGRKIKTQRNCGEAAAAVEYVV